MPILTMRQWSHPCIPQLINRRLWELTPEDREHLRNMLEEEEEEWESIEYVLYILMYILQQQTQPNNFSEVMAILSHELQDAMKEHRYQSVYNTLQILRKNLDTPKVQDHWSVPLLGDFFASLSGKAFLNVTQGDWKQIAGCDPKELSYLKRSLLLLNPSAILVIGPMLLELESNQTKKMLMSVIGILAEREFEHLAKLVFSSNTELVKMLIHIMEFMQSEQSFKELRTLLRHSSAGARKGALRAVCHRNRDIISDCFWLMDDPDEDVRQLFLTYASQQRDIKTERLLRDYLEKHRIHFGNKQFLFRAYIALGRCGSDESLPFLKKNLFFWRCLSILRRKKSLRRQAAVFALKELNTENAEALLNKISKKLHSNSNETLLSPTDE
ncbi:MAG: HEAT repeat domain-containing protein [Desulfobacterales bacterium]|nr:MAG: HEAT repeat domain-containing protein [Desulfobacterales bacterium]